MDKLQEKRPINRWRDELWCLCRLPLIICTKCRLYIRTYIRTYVRITTITVTWVNYRMYSVGETPIFGNMFTKLDWLINVFHPHPPGKTLHFVICLLLTDSGGKSTHSRLWAFTQPAVQRNGDQTHLYFCLESSFAMYLDSHILAVSTACLTSVSLFTSPSAFFLQWNKK